MPQIPFCKKSSSSSLSSQNNTIFHRSYVGFLGVFFLWCCCCCLGQSFSQRKQESKRERTFSLLPLSSLFLSLSFNYYYFFLPCPSLFLFTLFLFLYLSIFFSSILSLLFPMKKMKKVVSLEASPYAVYEDARTRLKHQSLMQDYEELEKETEAMKNRLKIMEQKKQTLLAEVRFLRRRYKYLTEKQPTNHQMKRDHSQLQNYENRSASITKRKNQSKKEFAFRYPPIPFDLNQKERAYNGMEAPLQKPAPYFDLNQKVRILSGKEAVPLLNSRLTFDLNQQERFHSGIEAAKRKITPSFDLNQVSGEEEELQANNCEPFKGLLRNANTEEQHNDMKLLVCRNIGNGSNRAGKRKITWQDQVALRV